MDALILAISFWVAIFGVTFAVFAILENCRRNSSS